MTVDYTEEMFESAIEEHLLQSGSYIKATPNTFDRQRCLDPTTLIPFIWKTQSKEWEYLKNIQKEKAEETLIFDFIRALDSEHETGNYETLQRKIEKSISKLREYRTALISAAVTGKIDARSEET
jgi:hypothetical protein